jgi:hypothetical protein
MRIPENQKEEKIWLNVNEPWGAQGIPSSSPSAG